MDNQQGSGRMIFLIAWIAIMVTMIVILMAYQIYDTGSL